MINGIVYDYESITLMTPAGKVNSLDEIAYSQSKDVDVVTDVKGIPRGTVRKAYEGDFSATMSLYEYNIMNSGAGVTGIFAMDPVPIIVSFAKIGALVITHTLTVKITKIEPVIQKDGEVKIKIEGKQTAVMKINGVPVYTPLI